VLAIKYLDGIMLRIYPHQSLGFHCSLTVKTFMGALERKLKALGITRAQFLALEHLFSAGPLSQAELTDRLSITSATCVRLIDRLERDGWVMRHADPKDGRVKRVVPSKRITKEWPKISRAGRDVLSQAYRGIDPAEIESVKRVLSRIRENLKP
jgi:MarR family transcriptional regulator, transcriptional regulator for hemolysin